MELVDLRPIDGLAVPRRPLNDEALDLGGHSQPEVQPPLILGAEAAAAADLLHLHLMVPVELHARANRTAIARRALQLDVNQVPSWLYRVSVDQERSPLVRDEHIEH